MKTRRNPFLSTATLVAATVLLAGQQAAFAENFNLDSFGPQTFTWNTDTSWNPDATGGTGPLAADSVLISGNLTGTTTINYATGTAATRGITNIIVSDSDNGSNSGAIFNFSAGVAGSALQFSTSNPTVSTNIVNQNSGNNRLTIENPLFQSGTTFSKGSVGNVQLKMTSAASVTSFNDNVSTLTSSGSGGTGALYLSATSGTTAVTLPAISLGTNNTGLILGSGTFTATNKTIALGTGRLTMGSTATLNLAGTSTISGSTLNLGSGASAEFNIGGNAVINMNGTTATFVDLRIENQRTNGVNTYNQQGGITNISGTAILGNPSASGAADQTFAVNISGGSFNFTRASDNADFVVGRNARTGTNTGAVTLNGSVTVSATGLLDLGGFTRVVLGTDTSNYADNTAATLTLDGGTLKTAREILRGTNSGVGGTDSTLVKLNGGTLQTTAAIPELFSSFGNTATNGILVSSGGAVIDTNGFNSGTATVLQEHTASTGGGLTKKGNGILTLGAANTYTGATNVTAGTLLVNGHQSAATGTVSVSANATLGGSGSIGGAVNVSTGGYLAPGASAGNLTLKNGLTMGGIFSWDLGALSTSNPGIDFDTITITAGNADITGASLGLNLGANAPSAIPFWQTNQTWSGIINNTGSGSLTGIFAAIDNSAWSSLGSFSTTYTANDVNLAWTAVPEPSTTALTGMLVTAGILRRRRSA